jgi:predicted small lipoprotein YifL
MPKSQIVALFILAASLMLAACGQKGPLYLPADDAAQAQDADVKKKPGEGEM